MGRWNFNIYTKIFGEIDDPKLESRLRFHLLAQTPEEENDFDIDYSRNVVKPCGVFATVMNLVKSALGGGVLCGHVAFMQAGFAVALPVTVVLGTYMAFCQCLLVWTVRKLCRRTKVRSMSYPDAGEAAFSCFHSLFTKKYALWFRYFIDVTIMMESFGSCATYEIMIAKTVKQLVENTQDSKIEGHGYFPHLRVYLFSFLVPMVCACMVFHLKWLAPLATLGNLILLLNLAVVFKYAIKNSLADMAYYKRSESVFEFLGIIVFAMYPNGITMPAENYIKNPKKYYFALCIAMSLIVVLVVSHGFFGYMAFLEKAEAPITFNFPNTLLMKIMKGLICLELYVTHAVNFWSPFNLCWYYLKRKHKSRFVMWELVYRGIIVTIIVLVAIIFPSINSVMGLLGSFCMGNMALIWPNLLYIMVIWKDPGLGKFKWRLWFHLTLILFGIIILVAGSLVQLKAFVKIFKAINLHRRGELKKLPEDDVKVMKFL